MVISGSSLEPISSILADNSVPVAPMKKMKGINFEADQITYKKVFITFLVESIVREKYRV